MSDDQHAARPATPAADALAPAAATPGHGGGPTLSRRRLLAYAVSAPVLTMAAGVGVNLATPGTAQALTLPLTPPDTVDFYDLGDSLVQTALPTMPLVRLEVGLDGRVHLALPRLEAGQGLDTACAMMVAEELDVPLASVDVSLEEARPELVFNQISGASAAVRCFHAALPLMAAAARARLLLAAAQQWGVSASTLQTLDGVVWAPDGRSLAYSALTALAGTLPLPGGVLPKSPAQYRLLGRPTGRLDARAIVTGAKRFAMDLDVPGALPTLLRMPSQIRGRVLAIHNLNAVRSMPGVVDIVVIPEGGSVVPHPRGVAVMAQTFGQAWDAANALDIQWGDGPMKGQSNASITARLKGALAPMALPPLGALTVGGDFEFPAAAHAPLEVETAIADVRPDRCEIWAGMQTPIIALQSIALDLGLPQNAVRAHVIPTGGSFGRRLFWDPVQVAVQVSKATGRPCKLMYHRSDDTRQTRLRPPQVHRARATVLLGRVISYDQRVAAVRLDARHGYGEIATALAGALPTVVQQTVGNLAYEQFFFKTMVASPYNFGVGTKILTPVNLDMPTVSFRSVHIQPARCVEEIIVDEVARRLRRDPVAFRLQHLRLARARAVLQQVVDAGQWGRSLPAGFAQGVAVHQETRSFTACLVEIDARDPGNAKVVRAVIAVDVGKPLNPLGIQAQAEGGLADAITLVLNAGLTIVDGLPLESSYTNYRVTKMRDFPKDIQVIVMPDNGEPIGGMGEVGLSAASGAIANAYARATGRKPRKFPLNAPFVFTPVPAGRLPEPVFV